MSRIIQLLDQTRTIRQGYVDDIPFAKKFYDVRNFLFAKMSRIIHLPDHPRIIRQRYASDIQFAKKFCDVHLPDQTPMLFFALLRLRTTGPSHFNG
jgi:hypothetical protein